MWNKSVYTFIAIVFLLQNAFAQACDITVSGNVYDDASQSPLAYVNIYIQEIQNGTTTDDDGNFVLENICPGHYHFILSHIGCEDEKFHFDISRDTTISISLSHTPTSLGTVVIAGKKEVLGNHANISVKRNQIEDNGNQSLSRLLENETGVHLIKNGGGISKPVIHGLYGNRLMILNNGIAQSGQQWGNDHSPEIDPFSSDKITILKGASVIEYAGGNLGSILLSEPNRIQKEPHLHGQINYIFESNGRGSTINARIGKYAKKLAWRATGTLKKYGDRKAANYFLNNTGAREANLSLQLEKSIKDKLFLDFYASTFNTQLGVLRGAQIGSVEDLERAILRDTPFYTDSTFSYQIEAPQQKVSHHFIKNKAKYFFNEHQIVELVLAGQLNHRKEFDIRRSGRTTIPSMSLKQYTFNTDLSYTHSFKEKWKLKAGNQQIITDNTNSPETGVLPLIPDYISWKSGFFSTLTRSDDTWFTNIGVRYDYENQTVLTITNTAPPEVVRFENQFNNISSLFSLKRQISTAQSIGWNIGYAMRNPAINELYSQGLHQGVSGIEEGDVNLALEKALKNTLEYKWVPSSNFAFNALAYYQHFDNYIFLNPQDEVRLTIRGAFPVFKYEQTDARIYGLDVSSQFTLGHSLLGVFKYSYLKGEDLSNGIPLIYMPPNSTYASLTYRSDKSLRLFNQLKMEDAELEITNRYVFEQKNILETQDFLPPPSSYNLTGLKISSNLILPKYKIRVFAKVENLFNVSYRDYLNRQRYFADDLGISLTLGVNTKF